MSDSLDNIMTLSFTHHALFVCQNHKILMMSHVKDQKEFRVLVLNHEVSPIM